MSRLRLIGWVSFRPPLSDGLAVLLYCSESHQLRVATVTLRISASLSLGLGVYDKPNLGENAQVVQRALGRRTPLPRGFYIYCARA